TARDIPRKRAHSSRSGQRLERAEPCSSETARERCGGDVRMRSLARAEIIEQHTRCDGGAADRVEQRGGGLVTLAGGFDGWVVRIPRPAARKQLRDLVGRR